MFKKSIIAMSAIGLLGATAPAMAGAFGDENHSDVADSFRISLQQRDVNATRVSEWGEYIQAHVILPDGTSEFQYFDPVTFERVTF